MLFFANMSERQTGLCIQRPVLNFNQAVADRLWNKAEDLGLPRGFMKRLLHEDSGAELVRPYEIRAAQKLAGVPHTPQTMDSLAVDIEETWCNQATEYLTVPTYPVHESSPRHRTSRVLFSVANHELIQVDRRNAINAINTIYGIEPPEDEPTTMWHDRHFSAGLAVVTIKRVPENMDILRSFLKPTSSAFPMEAELGPISVEDVYE